MEDKKKKVGRTVNLDPDLNDRLISLCSHLGVNPNSYLLNEIGKAVSRDEVSFFASRHADNSSSVLKQFFEEAAKAEYEAAKD